jgi:tetratricopeptide (TPR) repeat protein
MGHGEFSKQTGQGCLVLENQQRGPRLITGESLSHLLKGLPELRLVVLNACETAVTTMKTGHEPFGGVAQALVRGGLPAVVAMSHPISDRAAISFSANLYRRLAAGDPLDAAVVEGRLAVYAESLDSPEWGIPAVFLRVPNATLFEGGPNSQARALYDRGLMSFKRKNFRLAREHFRNVLALRPDYEDAELYLCLSTLSMNAPTMLTPFAADQLNEQLDRLTRSSRKRVADLSRLALAVLRLDYYEQKRIKAKGTPTDELFRTLQDGQPSREQREALAAVARSRRAALRFRLDH